MSLETPWPAINTLSDRNPDGSAPTFTPRGGSLDGLRKVVAETRGDPLRSEFHRGWASCSDMITGYMNAKLPPQRLTRPINEIGLGIAGLAGEHLRDFRIYEENGSVQIWVAVARRRGDTSLGDIEALQYLTPDQAMAFAKAFERCAIQALKNASAG